MNEDCLDIVDEKSKLNFFDDLFSIEFGSFNAIHIGFIVLSVLGTVINLMRIYGFKDHRENQDLQGHFCFQSFTLIFYIHTSSFATYFFYLTLKDKRKFKKLISNDCVDEYTLAIFNETKDYLSKLNIYYMILMIALYLNLMFYLIGLVFFLIERKEKINKYRKIT